LKKALEKGKDPLPLYLAQIESNKQAGPAKTAVEKGKQALPLHLAQMESNKQAGPARQLSIGDLEDQDPEHSWMRIDGDVSKGRDNSDPGEQLRGSAEEREQPYDMSKKAAERTFDEELEETLQNTIIEERERPEGPENHDPADRRHSISGLQGATLVDPEDCDVRTNGGDMEGPENSDPADRSFDLLGQQGATNLSPVDTEDPDMRTDGDDMECQENFHPDTDFSLVDIPAFSEDWINSDLAKLHLMMVKKQSGKGIKGRVGDEEQGNKRIEQDNSNPVDDGSSMVNEGLSAVRDGDLQQSSPPSKGVYQSQ
jgi:hypothetical protein